MFTKKALTSCLLGASILSSQAGTIYFDDFSGSGASLNGTTPDTTTGAATWSSHASLLDNGFPVNATDASALLPITLVSDMFYTLTVVLTANTTAADNDWLGFGFNGSPTVATAGTSPGANTGRFTEATNLGKVWAILREASTQTGSDDVQFFTTGTAAQITTSETDASFDGSLSHTASIELNTAGGILTARMLVDGTDLSGGFQAVPGVAMADIKGVGLTHNNVTNAGVNFDSFTLTVVPEPSTALLGGLSLLGLLRRRRA